MKDFDRNTHKTTYIRLANSVMCKCNLFFLFLNIFPKYNLADPVYITASD